jgi:hypothetical protein
VASFDEVVPPGKAGNIKASIHTANLKGPIGKSITVTHDDATQQPIVLGVTAKIIGSVDVFPFAGMQLARRRRGFENPAKLLIRKDPTEKGTLAITGLAPSKPWLKTTARRVDAAEPAADGMPPAQPGDFVLSVQAVGAPVGSHVENVSFKTGLGREPKITIPVTVSVQAAVNLQPMELVVTADAKSPGGASGEVLASIREDLDPKTLTLRSDNPAFVARAEPPGERAFRVIVTWDGKGPRPTDATTVHLNVGTESVDLPVRVERAGAPTPP